MVLLKYCLVNRNGLIKSAKIYLTLSFLKSHRLDLIAVTETHFDEEGKKKNSKIIQKHKNLDFFATTNDIGKRKGIVLIYDKNKLTMNLIKEDPNSRYIVLKIKKGTLSTNIIGIYAPKQRQERMVGRKSC